MGMLSQGRARSRATIVVVLAVGGCAAGTANAATLSWTGAVTATDPAMSELPFSTVVSTCSTVEPESFGAQPRYDAYALRNTGGDDCVGVTVDAPVCGEGLAPTTYLGTFSPTSVREGLVGGGTDLVCQAATGHVAAVPAGRTFVATVHGFGAVRLPTSYTLTVEGTSLAPAKSVDAGGAIPRGNAFDLHASSLADGSAPEGDVSVDGPSGKHFDGPVRCLRVSGDNASLVMTIANRTNVPSIHQGAVFWLDEGPDGTPRQRNSLLTARRLARTYPTSSSCPDPSAPAGTPQAVTGAGAHVSVVDTPPPT